MAEFPAIPFWTDAYIADTQHLTNEEHGVYVRLLMSAWRSPGCALPNDDKRLAIMVGVTMKKWAALKPTVMAFWTLEDGLWRQKRLTREREFVLRQREQKRVAGKASAKSKLLKTPRQASTAEATAAPTEGQRGRNNPHPHPHPCSVSKDTGEAGLSDPSKLLFDHGVALLGEARIGEAKARSLIGKWRKAHGAEAVLTALGRAQREGAIEPVSFIEGCFKFKAKNGDGPSVGDERTLNGEPHVYEGAAAGWVPVRE